MLEGESTEVLQVFWGREVHTIIFLKTNDFGMWQGSMRPVPGWSGPWNLQKRKVLRYHMRCPAIPLKDLP